MVKSRLLLNFPGFEPTDPAHQLDRIRHSAAKTGELWGFSWERESAEFPQGASHALSESVTRGANWEVRTRLVQFSWNDIIARYENEPHPQAFLKNLPKFLAFFADGTVWRYFRASQRYFYFTIFPILLIAIFLAVSLLASWWALSFALSGAALWIAAIVAAAILTLVLCRWPGQSLYLLLTVNDWGFARDMVLRANPQIEARYREFADTVEREIAASDHDEILVCGHSFGAVWAVAALALALERKPDLLAGRRVTFLALGSSLLKIALAPRAGFMRDWAARVMAEPGLFWHEIQTKNDIIAFYKADPFETLGIRGHAATLQIDRPNYKKAMNKARYRKMRKSFYATHRQYILYQDVRAPFDTQLRYFGPFDSRELAESPQLAASIDESGRLV